jgi:hypothetical protein
MAYHSKRQSVRLYAGRCTSPHGAHGLVFLVFIRRATKATLPRGTPEYILRSSVIDGANGAGTVTRGPLRRVFSLVKTIVSLLDPSWLKSIDCSLRQVARGPAALMAYHQSVNRCVCATAGAHPLMVLVD